MKNKRSSLHTDMQTVKYIKKKTKITTNFFTITPLVFSTKYTTVWEKFIKFIILKFPTITKRKRNYNNIHIIKYKYIAYTFQRVL